MLSQIILLIIIRDKIKRGEEVSGLNLDLKFTGTSAKLAIESGKIIGGQPKFLPPINFLPIEGPIRGNVRANHMHRKIALVFLIDYRIFIYNVSGYTRKNLI